MVCCVVMLPVNVQLRQDIGHILLVITENHKALSNIVAVLMSLQDEVNSLRDTLRRQQSSSFVIQPPSSSLAAVGPPPPPVASAAATAAPGAAGAGFVAALTRKRSHDLRPESTSSSTDRTSRKSSKASQ